SAAETAEPAPGVAAAPAATPAEADWRARWRDLRAQLRLTVDEGSRWRKHPLRGEVRARLEHAALPELSVQLSHGENRVEAKGALGGSADQVDFRIALPQPQT